jgi:hypothetical protein
MPKRIPEEALAAIEQTVQTHPEGASLGDIADALTPGFRPAPCNTGSGISSMRVVS